MNQTIFAQEGVSHFQDNIVNQVFSLRYDTFVGRLGWEVNGENGQEKDKFDELDPFHIAVTDEEGSVAGCFRALPTQGDYMLRSIFPELLQGESLPDQEDIWEISRFLVRKGSSDNALGYMSHMTILMMRSFYDFAKLKNISSYVAVTTVACERMLRKMGVTVRRMGEAKALKIGKESTVALWIQVDENLKVQTH